MNMKQFQKSIKGKTVLVDFSATWCKPCKEMKSIIKAIISEYEGKAVILEMDIDSQKKLATDFMVQSIPTQIIFKDGREMKRLVGMQSKSTIERSLNDVL